MEKDYADPEAVLRHDYVGLLMLAAQNGPQLRLLIQWGGSLRYYIGMIQANYASDSTVQVPRVQVDKTWNDPAALLDYDPAGVAIRTKGNSSLQSQLVEFATQLEHYAKMNEALLRQNSTTGHTTAAAAPEPPVPEPAASMPKQEEEMEEEKEEPQQQPREARSAKRKSSTPIKEEEPDQKRRADDEFSPLSESPLRHSVPLTRTTLRTHAEELGLGPFKHNRPVALTKDTTKVSHVMLRHDWIDFNYEERQNFQWTLENNKDYNVRMVEKLDPQKKQGVIPLFLFGAQKNANNPHKLQYVGHYRCVDRVVVNQGYDDSQLRLEFKFHRFDQKLADKMEGLAS